ncbi:hypothetical protein CcaverHIS002_0103800 [Cutaneotrichosporon cavernicola]|uniref:Amidohydrolase-related domain-containing protein n=1 Tax=Cutaneotrichosporon cavernicola TaxID=279322 RepID=A0AA48I4D7_9TREE|nr:uncharacterized protein CcaverHIS019_0103730 [Cutaneotrichosporon cavernicola]BEI79851.1 hypothetical protein CcaverHIS002_0103800 [Cutaneotrichosporon cavernicola]BEI87655.1 hypothetical protein CcaverHIS019_0103730 [Cutaneotrichosporon cavernicola]BEI95427.1 hypothetical protein CcaverHIS631_0103760 [Cutaneotrichosporon cavernicola]BEJ03201.1 hypothetical protein CcaverHIS641_0103760 [Cutaneotrichosporon cavernicola]
MSKVDDFEMVDDGPKGPYEWTPPHWVPYPVPLDYDIFAAPWIRPEQVPMSFLGVNVICTEHLKVQENMTVRIRKGVVESVEKTKPSDMQEAGYSTIDAKGLYMCPGLIDCHTHITATPGQTMTSLTGTSETDTALKTAYVLRGMLSRGFTTVRDVGGANRHLKNATADWLIPGPRIFQGGPIMSQTGGHGDMSSQDSQIGCCQITPWGHGPQLSAVADGVDACLKTARKIMQMGADHIKICSSGGVASPTDRLESTQFTVPEIRAICDTVRMMGGRLVTAHCFTTEGARNAIEGGIGGIEHGNLIDEDTLKLMVKKGIHLTPTLIVCDLLSRPPYNAIIPPASREKLTHVQEMGFVTLKKAHDLGVNIAFGTDAFSSMQPLQLSEFELRKRVLSSPVVLRQATFNGAKVLGMEGKVGVVAKGAFADLILLSANPLEDVAIFNHPHKYLHAVVKDGRCVSSKIKDLRVEVPLM